MKLSEVTWRQHYIPDYSKGIPEDPAHGEHLGTFEVRIEVPRDESYPFAGFEFTGNLYFSKFIWHGEAPTYFFRTSSASAELAEYDLPIGIRTALDSGVYRNLGRW